MPLSKPPIYSEEAISLKKLREFLQISSEDLAGILEAKSTVEEGVPLAKLQKLVEGLWRELEGSTQEVRMWLHESKEEWCGLSPMDAMKVGKIQSALDLFERSMEGELSGG